MTTAKELNLFNPDFIGCTMIRGLEIVNLLLMD